ncbi:MAG: M23 family metallopeptidase [Clostridia bacterium]|nr:M23 family metallopeptidase [Clostridia bacterium]
MNLYKSQHFALTGIITAGKKQTAGQLWFEGLPSYLASGREVTAIEGGVVVSAGCCLDRRSRLSRLGNHVRIAGSNGVHIIYGRLACRLVKEGDFVVSGQEIGIQGSSGVGRGDYLTLEFRRNNRRVDGLEYLNLPRRIGVCQTPEGSRADMICQACRIDDWTRLQLDSIPDIWDILYPHLNLAPAFDLSEYENRIIY